MCTVWYCIKYKIKVSCLLTCSKHKVAHLPTDKLFRGERYDKQPGLLKTNPKEISCYD